MDKNFDKLKKWKKEALYMSMFQGLSGAAISRSLNIPERTVQDNIKRLKDMFKLKQIRDYGEGKYQNLFKHGAKILFGDIETSYAASLHWGQWGQNLAMKQSLVESHLLSHAWAWNDGEIKGSVLTVEEVLERDDSRLALEIWTLLDECDIYVAHNGKKFDVRKINGYFLKHGLPPPSPYKVVDTMQMSRRKFGLPFHSLAYLAKFLGVTDKLDNAGSDLWKDCFLGKAQALQDMLTYNIGDIDTLREVYNILIRWDNDAVNMSLYVDVPEGTLVCVNCGGTDIAKLEDKFAYTPQRKYHVYRCKCCSVPMRGGTKSGEDTKLYRIV